MNLESSSFPLRPRCRRLGRAAVRLTAILLVPPVYRWLRRQETIICRHGRPLGAEEVGFAQALGLASPDRIRIRTVSRIPLPLGWLLKAIARFSRVVLANPAALTAGRGIYVLEGLDGDRALIRHELVHVRQYERLGRRAFLKRYIRGCLVYGYEGSPLEVEARRRGNMRNAGCDVCTAVVGPQETIIRSKRPP